MWGFGAGILELVDLSIFLVMMEKNKIIKSGDGFIDRSKVRILLCDKDLSSSQEVLTLLCKCSYQGNLSVSFCF